MTHWRASLVATALIAVASGGAWAADDVEDGRSLFNDTCASCHGRDMANPGLAFDLRKFPRDDPDRFRNSVLNGKCQGMPALAGKLSEEDLKLLWAFVESGG